MKKVSIFAGCVILAFLPGLTGFIAQPDAWYAGLVKPPLQLPNWVFAPVWSLLYLLMGIAHGLYATAAPLPSLREGPAAVLAVSRKKGHALQVLQLALNAAWTLIFFGSHAPLAAGIEIVCLLAAILLTMNAFVKVSRPAAWLLVPYVAWVSFATYLNWGVVVLNR